MALPYPIDDGGTDFPTNPIVYTYDPITGEPIPSQEAVTGISGPISKFQTALGRYPSNAKQWWVAKADADDPDKGVKAGDFLPLLLETFFSGNNRAPRGHYILNQFRKDRSLVSGVGNIPVDDSGERPNSVTFFSGRVWYACQSTVFYSQILDNTSYNKAGLCYQEADPTAEDISDLIASDGGVVPIPEADHIEALYPLANGVMVFSRNGVWFISGGDSSFSALNISTTKVSPIGTKSPKSIVETDGTIFWWSELGIQALQQASGQFGPIPNRFGNTNIAEQTIQTFYNSIGTNAKHKVKATFDPLNNLIYWIYNTDDSDIFEYNGILIYDITLQAFYPWEVSQLEGGPRINGAFIDSGYIEASSTEAVTDLNVPVTDGGIGVSVFIGSLNLKPSSLYYLTEVPEEGLTVSAPISLDYVDWKNFDAIGATFDSFIMTGFELNDDAMRSKQIVYMFVHFRRTEDEEGFNPSSCKMTARWDWAGDRTTRRWSNEVEVYRLPLNPNHTTEVVVSKNKVRGHGKSVQFRFGTDEPGRTFDLLGWSVAYSGNTQP